MVVVPLRPRRLGHVRALSGEALRDAGLEAASRRAVLGGAAAREQLCFPGGDGARAANRRPSELKE